ncbi:MAG: hypothetical protein ACKPA9_07335, partial [Microcystis sp.]
NSERMQKMIHKFQLNSINCATMPRGKIPAAWFLVPLFILTHIPHFTLKHKKQPVFSKKKKTE